MDKGCADVTQQPCPRGSWEDGGGTVHGSPCKTEALQHVSEGWGGISGTPLPPLELNAKERKGIHPRGNRGNSI